MKHIVYDTKKQLILPETINEVTGTQLIELAAILNTNLKRKDAQLRCLRTMSGLRFLDWYRLPAAIKVQAMPFIEWCFDDFTLTKQVLPEYKGFYGPKSELENLTLSEFYFAELYYSQHLAGDADAINNLVAVLYRKGKFLYHKLKDKDGDIRVPFNANLIFYYANIISDWPMPVKQAIVLFYDGCRKDIANNNPKIFNAAGSSESNGQADMFGILRSLSGGKYGDLEKVEKMYLHTALLEMNICIQENEEMQAKMKKTA